MLVIARREWAIPCVNEVINLFLSGSAFPVLKWSNIATVEDWWTMILLFEVWWRSRKINFCNRREYGLDHIPNIYLYLKLTIKNSRGTTNFCSVWRSVSHWWLNEANSFWRLYGIQNAWRSRWIYVTYYGYGLWYKKYYWRGFNFHYDLWVEFSSVASCDPCAMTINRYVWWL